jgi:hypothetical protein
VCIVEASKEFSQIVLPFVRLPFLQPPYCTPTPPVLWLDSLYSFRSEPPAGSGGGKQIDYCQPNLSPPLVRIFWPALLYGTQTTAVGLTIAVRLVRFWVNFWLRCCLAVARAISRRLPTAKARVRALTMSFGIYSGQNINGACFLRILRFPLPLIHSTNCSAVITIYHSGWYDRSISGRSNSGLGSIPAPIHQ